MSAFVEHSFPRGFLLDEERLRKLKDLIETRLAKNPAHPAPLEYKVYRGDSYSYVTPSVDDVAKEDNEDWKRITRLELRVDNADDLTFLLSFSSKGCELRITGADRDNVFLLFSDLRDYINNDITVSRGWSGATSKIIGLALMMVFLIVFFFFTFSGIGSSHLDEPRVRDVLANPDSAAKLNFLITDRMKGDPNAKSQRWWFPAFMLVFIFFSSNGVQAISRYVFPRNEFLFGKRRASFNKRQGLMGNLVWVVLVGLAVAVIGGLIVWRVTGSH